MSSSSWILEPEEAWYRKYRIDLDTPRLLLRPLISEDADWLTLLFTDRELSTAWSTRGGWNLVEFPAPPFSHCLAAARAKSQLRAGQPQWNV